MYYVKLKLNFGCLASIDLRNLLSFIIRLALVCVNNNKCSTVTKMDVRRDGNSLKSRQGFKCVSLPPMYTMFNLPRYCTRERKLFFFYI